MTDPFLDAVAPVHAPAALPPLEEWLAKSSVERSAAEAFMQHHSAKRYHEAFVVVEELARNSALPLKERMEMLLVLVLRQCEYYNETALLAIAAELALQALGRPGLEFIRQWERLAALSDDNKILYTSTCALNLLEMGEVDRCEDLMESLKAKIDKGFGLRARSEAMYHHVLSELYKARRDYTRVYRHAMYFLKNGGRASVTPESATAADVKLAEDLCMAALLSPQVYSFTELLQEDIIKVISPGSPRYDSTGGNLWRDLTVICSNGDHSLYQVFVNMKQAELASLGVTDQLPLIESKLKSFALLELAMRKPPNQRVLSFAEIAEACQVPPEAVERLVLGVMRRKLLQGKVDIVDQTVSFHKLQPRVLDEAKIRTMASQFADWARQMQAAANKMNTLSPSVLKQTTFAL